MLRASALNASIHVLAEGSGFRRLKPQSSKAPPGLSSAEHPVAVFCELKRSFQRSSMTELGIPPAHHGHGFSLSHIAMDRAHY